MSQGGNKGLKKFWIRLSVGDISFSVAMSMDNSNNAVEKFAT